MKFVRRRHIDEAVELNITAFLNLMVILVPFLLITAVFSRLTILELNLPALDAIAKQDEKVKLQLELVIRENSFDIQDARLGLITQFQRQGDEINWKLFTDMLLEIKSRFPEEQNITLLLEPKTNYKTMIQVMDHVRSADVVQFGSVENVELFPNVSIGDAPASEFAAEISTENQLQRTDNTIEEAAQ